MPLGITKSSNNPLLSLLSGLSTDSDNNPLYPRSNFNTLPKVQMGGGVYIYRAFKFRRVSCQVVECCRVGIHLFLWQTLKWRSIIYGKYYGWNQLCDMLQVDFFIVIYACVMVRYMNGVRTNWMFSYDSKKYVNCH